MTTEQENFAVNLTAKCKTHDEWLSVVRFGLATLLENQRVFAEIIVSEAQRCAESVPDHKPSDHIGSILCSLGLKLSVA